VYLASRLIDHFLVDLTQERKTLRTLRVIMRFAVQAIGVLAVVFVLFGVPSQMSTILGLAGAGLTVALKDFIVGFFGWFVLMGKNGIRVGDWVEINGVVGEVVEINWLRTVLLETGNWTDSGHPTGRKVAFVNSFSIEGHFFNFSTSGQWLWDELALSIPPDQDPYKVIEAIQKLVTEETAANAQKAEQEWKHTAGRYQVQFSPGCGNNGNYLPENYPRQVTLAAGKVDAGIESAGQMNFSGREVVLHEPKGVLDHFMDTDAGESGLGRSGELQQLSDERIDPFGFAADEAGHFDVLVPFCQEVRERFDGHERVFDFVRHACRQSADAGQPLESADATLQLPGRIEIVKNRDHNERVSRTIRAQGSGRVNRSFFLRVGKQNNGPVGDRLARSKSFLDRLLQRRRQPGHWAAENRLSRQTRDPLGRPIESRHGPLRVNRNDSGFHGTEEKAGEVQTLGSSLYEDGFLNRHTDVCRCRANWTAFA